MFMEGLLTADPRGAMHGMGVDAEQFVKLKICLKLCGPAYNNGFISLARLMEVMWDPFLKLAARIHQVSTEQTKLLWGLKLSFRRLKSDKQLLSPFAGPRMRF